MYVVVNHTIHNPETAFPRGTRLMSGEGAPEGTRVLQFYPARDGSATNHCYEVDGEKAFSERPLGLAGSASVPS